MPGLCALDQGQDAGVDVLLHALALILRMDHGADVVELVQRLVLVVDEGHREILLTRS